MRVIAGSVRGMRLTTPAGDRVRPTLERVREALFNIIGPDLPGKTFLDLFAGSGANGIEALSRGASRAVFVDNHKQSAACIEKNLASTRLAASALVMRYGLPNEVARVRDQFDYIFADPPHDMADYEALLTAIDGGGLVAVGGQVIIEHSSHQTVPQSVGALELQRQRRYGKTTLSFYA